MLHRTASDHGSQLNDVCNENIRALHHLDGEGGIHNITAGQSKVEPAARPIIDVLRHAGREGDHIMIECFLQLLASLQIERSARAHELEVFARNNFLLHERLGRKEFDLQPNLKFALLRPDFPHGGT